MSDRIEFDDRLGMAPQRWVLLKRAGAFIGALASVVTLAGFAFKVPQIDLVRWLSPSQALFPPDPRLKGITSPTVDSLAFKNVDSRSNVNHFLENRNGRSPKTREFVEKLLQKILDDERGNPSLPTQAYLQALYGQYCLQNGDGKAGIEKLEQARALSPDDQLIKALLLRAYEEAHHNLVVKRTPWSLLLQQQVQDYSLKIDELRRQLRPFFAAAVPPRLSESEVDRYNNLGGIMFSWLTDQAGAGATVISQVNLSTSTDQSSSGMIVLHFAGHGSQAAVQPDPSGLVLSQVDGALARPRDGFLHACEIHGLPADLVVLSACSTALGAEVHGEGLMDLNTDTGNNALVFQVSHRPRALLRPWLEARLEQPHLHLGLQLARADLERAFRLEERAGAMREGAFIVAGFSDGAPPAQMAHLHLGLQLARADELLRKLWPFAAAAGPPCSSVPSLAAVSVASARAAAPCDTSVGALRGGRSFATGSDDAPMTRLWLAPEGSLHDTAPRDTSRHHALVVGINNYAAASGVAPLAYARRDAEREGDAFARLGYDTFRLIDGSATRENIINTLLREVLLSRSGDDFVFYYSGHGFADVHGRGALMTAAAGGQPVSVVPLSEIARILSFHRGTATVIIDSCLDGINVNLDGGGAHTNLVNGYGPNRARFISAGTPGSPALESERLQAGLYARALLDFLTHEAKRKHGSTGPYRLDFDGLFSATSVETARLARDLYGLEQHPARLTPSGNTVGR